jgi:hypothetical protein
MVENNLTKIHGSSNEVEMLGVKCYGVCLKILSKVKNTFKQPREVENT